jgi:hypothetical protein
MNTTFTKLGSSKAFPAKLLERAVFLGHIGAQRPKGIAKAESSGHCEPRVLRPLFGGFWLALFTQHTDAPNTRVFSDDAGARPIGRGAYRFIWKELTF